MVKAKINIIDEAPKLKGYTMTKTTLRSKYLNKPMKEAFFTASKPKTREEIVKLVKIAQKVAIQEKQDVDFIVGLRYNGGDRSGKIFSLDAEPDLFNPDTFYSGNVSTKKDKKGNNIHVTQQKTFKNFYIISVPRQSKKGGFDIKNDCLFNTIVKGLNGIQNIDVQWNTGERFKNRLNIERCKLVSIDRFPEIEEGLKINLNCYGSKTYISEGKYKRTVNINLTKNHYSLDKKHNNKKYKVEMNSKQIAYYEIDNNYYHIITKDNEWIEVIDITKPELSDKYKNIYFINMTKEVKTGFNKNGEVSKTKKITLKDLFTEFTIAQEILSKETNGEIDLSKTPRTKQAVQRLFHNMTKSFSEPDFMSQHEQEWHDKAFRGGIIYAEEGEYKDVKCYDQNSQYSYYLSQKSFYIPIKAGEFLLVDNDSIKEFARYGIYRCKISSLDKNKDKLFRFNSSNYYTHYDINHALKLGFKVDIIQDGSVNFLYYDGDKRICGDKLFKPIVDYLFDLKLKCKYAKKFLSSLWGSCMERNYKKYIISEKTEEVEISDSEKIITIERYTDHHKIKTTPYSHLFKTNWARLGAFLTSYVRFKMSDIISSNFDLNDVIRIHTDGVIVKNCEMKPDLLGQNIGQFKIEKQGNLVIYSNVSLTWEK